MLEASSLTNYEYITLLASLKAYFYSKYNCKKCLTQYGRSQRLIEKTKRNRTAQGCFDYNAKHRIENIIYKSCPGNYTTDISFFIELFAQYEKGMLPYKGSLEGQPNKIIEIFNVITAIKLEYQDSLK